MWMDNYFILNGAKGEIMEINIGSKKYLKTDEVSSGDVVKILDSGVIEKSTKYFYDEEKTRPKVRYMFKVEHNGEESVLAFNKYSRDALATAWGTDTEKWVGKTAKVTVELVRSLNKNMIILEPTDTNVKEIKEEDWED